MIKTGRTHVMGKTTNSKMQNLKKLNPGSGRGGGISHFKNILLKELKTH